MKQQLTYACLFRNVSLSPSCDGLMDNNIDLSNIKLCLERDVCMQLYWFWSLNDWQASHKIKTRSAAPASGRRTARRSQMEPRGTCPLSPTGRTTPTLKTKKKIFRFHPQHYISVDFFLCMKLLSFLTAGSLPSRTCGVWSVRRIVSLSGS